MIRRARRCRSARPFRHRWPGALAVLAAGAALAASGCSTRPIVQVHQSAPLPAALMHVAVAPFYPSPHLSRGRGAKEDSAWGTAAVVSRFVAEALSERDISVVAPSELETAFIGEGAIVPRGDGLAAAAVAHRNFRATSVMLGEVFRFRERSGSAVGSTSPASVAYRVTLYSAPEGRRLWVATFDETQPSVTADFFRARKYPGRGSRWLTAAELARFGAREIAASLPAPGLSAAPTAEP